MTAASGRQLGISLLLFAAAGGTSEVEKVVARVQWAIGVDLVEQVLARQLCERVIVASNAEGFLDQATRPGVIVERDAEDFHFGRRLHELIGRHRVHRVFYAGAGSTALLTPDELTGLCHRLCQTEQAVIPNNFWSCDFAGFVPGNALERVEPPAIDNNLAFLLNRKAGLPEASLPSTAGTMFDVDTPTDLLILALHPSTSPRVRSLLETFKLDTTRIRALARLLVDDRKEVVVAGRVGSAAWVYLERETACRIRLFSEERGMRASGREEQGRARSLLGFYVERYGPRGLFDALAELGDAAIVDSRVLFAHLGLRPSAADRFHSDLLEVERIADPFVRDITLAAREARIPVLLGGHSLVSGGLWGLVDAAWQGEA